jgi:HK97 family phage prohead protease
MIRKLCEAPQIKVMDPGTDGAGEFGSITCYATTWGNADRVGDVFVAGAFDESVESFLKDGFGAIGHDWGALPALYPVSSSRDQHGQVVTMNFHGTPEAQAARTIVTERLKAGLSVGVSVGFRTLLGGPVDPDHPYDGQKITKAELYEVSVVNVPCNPQALVLGAKGGPLAGLSMDDHSEAVLAAVREGQARMADIRETRIKDGRTLSQASVDRLITHAGAMEAAAADLRAMCEDAKPQPKMADETDILAAARAYAQTMARLSRIN